MCLSKTFNRPHKVIQHQCSNRLTCFMRMVHKMVVTVIYRQSLNDDRLLGPVVLSGSPESPFVLDKFNYNVFVVK